MDGFVSMFLGQYLFVGYCNIVRLASSVDGQHRIHASVPFSVLDVLDNASFLITKVEFTSASYRNFVC